MVKIPRRHGTITVRGEEEDAVRSVERAFKELAVSHPVDEDDKPRRGPQEETDVLSGDSSPEDTSNEHRRLGGWLHLPRSCSSLLGGSILLSAHQAVRPRKATASPQPKRVGKDAIF